MRTTPPFSRLSAFIACSCMLALAAAPAQSADPVSEAARALGGIFGGKSKPQAPANSGPTQADQADKSLEQAQQEDRTKGAVAGTAIGAAAGAVVHEDDRAKGAVVGGVAGGIVGAVVGNQMAQKRGDYAARYNEIDQSIANAEQRIQTLRTDTTRIERRITLREGQLKEADAQAAANKVSIAEHKATIAEVEADIAANEAASEKTMVAIKMVEDEIKSIEPQAKSDAELASRKSQLEAKRSELLAVLQRINNADTTLIAQRDALNASARS